MAVIDIGGRLVGEDQPCLLVAEVGVNHNGSTAVALDMVEAIADAGIEGVKFQTFRAEEFMNSPDETYTYLSQGAEVTESMLGMFQRLELAHEEFGTLFQRARERGLVALSTPTDTDAVDLLDELQVPAFKIGSDDLVHTPLLRYVAAKGRPVIISAGMASGDEVEHAIATIRAAGNDQILLLHCVSEYPTPPDHAHLRKIPALIERFGIPIGFSDHTRGVTAAIAAVAMGACMVEKHMTLDRGMPGPDHHFSADPPELRELAVRVREVESALGSADLVPTAEEEAMAVISRRSIVVKADLPAGHVLQADDLAFRRPGTGLVPAAVDRVVGARLSRPLPAGSLVLDGDLEPVR